MKILFSYQGLLVSFLILLGCVGLLYGEKIQKKYVKVNPPPQKICTHCNILFLDIDILRADALPCFGYPRNTAPNLCAFANKSVLFTDNYSMSNWTLPDIFSTITSLYPTFHRVRTMFVDVLSPKVLTLAEALKQEGYRTIYIGDNDNAATLTHGNGGLRGFDKILYRDQSIVDVISELSESSQPWFVYVYRGDLHMPYLIPEQATPIEKMAAPKGLPITFNDYDRLLNIYLKKHYTEIFNKKTIQQYRSVILSPDHYGDTRVTNLFRQLASDEKKTEYLLNIWEPQVATYMDSFDPNSASDVAYVRMMYDTQIKILDDALGVLFKKIDAEPLSGTTVTVVMSNHGEDFGEHGTFSHNIINHHTELFHTPLIIHSPYLPVGQITLPTANIDIYPTLLDLTGINIKSGLQGHSLTDTINRKNNDTKRYILSENNEGKILQNKNWLFFLPATASGAAESVLYDKVLDPAEKNNVASNYPELTRSLYEQAILLSSYDINTHGKNFNVPDIDRIKLDPEKIKQLQKQGYF